MKKKDHRHIVKTVKPGSIAEELEIAPGDKVLADQIITEIEDIFDYQLSDHRIHILNMLVEKPDGEQWALRDRQGIRGGSGNRILKTA